MTDNLILKDITDLIKNEYIFEIPSYQRGYRWERSHIEYLLKDLKDFIEQKNENDSSLFYCLQPLVVCKQNNENNKYIVVDGQQRLTTILLLVKYLEMQSKYNIIYSTRDLNLNELKNKNDSEYNKYKNRNIDSYCIYLGKEKIQQWFEKNKNKEELEKKFRNFIKGENNLKFIWYELNSGNNKDIEQIISFNNLNKTKIKLTDSEIIKAIFVLKSEEKNNIKVLLHEWDYIEQKLQDNRFWFFLTNGENYDTRIDFIFNLAEIRITDYDNNENLKISDKISKDWNEIKKVFNRCLSWYEDNKLYHYIGYLITIDNNIIGNINKNWERNKTYTKNLEEIKKKIKEKIKNNNISELDYDKDKSIIRNILLLFNIQTHISICDNDDNYDNYIYYRFPFELYKNSKNKWDIEHIDSQTENPLEKNKDKQIWLKFLKDIEVMDKDIENDYCKEYIEKIKKNLKEPKISNIINNIICEENEYFEKDKYLIKECVEFYNKIIASKQGFENRNWRILQLQSILLYFDLENNANLFKKEEFNKFYDCIIKIFEKEEYGDKKNKNSIDNLTLLDAKTNRGYGNALFPTKRQKIIEKDKQGVFIPICTKNLFLKYYTKEDKNTTQFYNNKWGSNDKMSYLKEIKEKLKDFL